MHRTPSSRLMSVHEQRSNRVRAYAIPALKKPKGKATPKMMPVTDMPSHRIPIGVLRDLQEIGFVAPSSLQGMLAVSAKMSDKSELYNLSMAHIDDLVGVPVALALNDRGRPEDPSFAGPPNLDGSPATTHWKELQNHLQDLAPEGTIRYPYNFPDASVAPPASCPSAQSIPEGA